jgi:hypothetical protein
MIVDLDGLTLGFGPLVALGCIFTVNNLAWWLTVNQFDMGGKGVTRDHDDSRERIGKVGIQFVQA